MREKEAEKALGYIGFVLSKDNLKEVESAPSGYIPIGSTQRLIKGLKEPQRANSILSSMGATWQNDYEDIDPDNYELPISKEEDYGEDQIRIFIKAGGRDNPFPIVIAKNNQDQWKITEGFSTICMDVRPPKSKTKDF